MNVKLASLSMAAIKEASKKIVFFVNGRKVMRQLR